MSGIALIRPAAAEVCGAILGNDVERLLKAPLWYQVGDRLLSPVPVGLVVLALLTATRVPRLRGMAFVASLLCAVQGVTAIGANVFPDDALLMARLEGCGGASLSAAILWSGLSILLATAFVIAPDRAERSV